MRFRRIIIAGRLFKAAGLYDQALESIRKAAHCSVKMGNLKQAAVTLETAAREWTVLPLPNSKGKDEAACLYNEGACGLRGEKESAIIAGCWRFESRVMKFAAQALNLASPSLPPSATHVNMMLSLSAVAAHLLEVGELVRAVDCKLAAGKLYEGFNKVRPVAHNYH